MFLTSSYSSLQKVQPLNIQGAAEKVIPCRIW